MENKLIVEGTGGRITLDEPWTPGRDAGPSDATIRVETPAGARDETLRDPRQLFAHEAEIASRAILDGRTEAPAPAMSPADSRGNAATLDRWRAAIGAPGVASTPPRRLRGVLPAGLPAIPGIEIPGVGRPLGRLVIGCDNRDTAAEGAIVWDAWMEAGGTTFDTAFVYGGGRHEAALGRWIADRGVTDETVVIVKGGHTPYCSPRAIEAQLEISLDRLGLERAPVHILHRDNTDVPVDEFVDLMSRLRSAGRIGAWGGSNWSVARFAAAAEAARRSGGTAPSILNNNLSLAVMERPVWRGCVTSNDPETLAFLRDTGVAHLSWSSQARGYFLDAGLRGRLPAETAPETCFGGSANAERRRRAEALAARLGVSAHNVATAWVLGQSFASLAIVGPRSAGEIASTLPALGLDLDAGTLAWLNLEAETPPEILAR